MEGVAAERTVAPHQEKGTDLCAVKTNNIREIYSKQGVQTLRLERPKCCTRTSPEGLCLISNARCIILICRRVEIKSILTRTSPLLKPRRGISNKTGSLAVPLSCTNIYKCIQNVFTQILLFSADVFHWNARLEISFSVCDSKAQRRPTKNKDDATQEGR